MMVLVAVASVTLVVAPPTYRTPASACAVAAAIHPFVGVAVLGSLVFVTRLRSISRARRRSIDVRTESLLAVDLVALGVHAGVAFDDAVRTAALHVDTAVGSTLDRIRRTFGAGFETEAEDQSPLVSMFRLAKASAVSGAPLANDLRRLVEVEEQRDDAAREERLQRLPVKMLFPLAFLILPGFVLVAVVPAVAGGVARLSL